MNILFQQFLQHVKKTFARKDVRTFMLLRLFTTTLGMIGLFLIFSQVGIILIIFAFALQQTSNRWWNTHTHLTDADNQ